MILFRGMFLAVFEKCFELNFIEKGLPDSKAYLFIDKILPLQITQDVSTFNLPSSRR